MVPTACKEGPVALAEMPLAADHPISEFLGALHLAGWTPTRSQ
jgi:hypothetical protein